MGKSRLEAFGDGVIAIIITIMVLELKVPRGENIQVLSPLIPAFLSYVLSFVYVGIYWNNHHHMLHTCCKVTGPMLWANLHLLFWLSLFPFATGWMGENHFSAVPSALYGVVLLMAAIAYWTLQQLIIASQDPGSLLRKAIGGDWKGKVSPPLYAVSIPTAFWSHWMSQGLFRAGRTDLACAGSTHRELTREQGSIAEARLPDRRLPYGSNKILNIVSRIHRVNRK
jgi:uncharacterized membrane protein